MHIGINLEDTQMSKFIIQFERKHIGNKYIGLKLKLAI